MLKEIARKYNYNYRYPLLMISINTRKFNFGLERENFSDVDHILISKDHERTVILEFKHINGYRDPNSKQTKALETFCHRNIVVWLFHNQEEPWKVEPSSIVRFEIWHAGNCKAKGNGYPITLINKWLNNQQI